MTVLEMFYKSHWIASPVYVSVYEASLGSQWRLEGIQLLAAASLRG